jgi:hypothetical protein
MTDKQPEALRLAEKIYKWARDYSTTWDEDRMLTEAAAELRRLHEVNAELVEALTGVVRVADRATVEFDAAKAALAKATGEQQ